MAGRTASAITEKLVGLGVSAVTPVAVAASIGRPDQVIRTCRLNSLAETVAAIGLANPVVIGIGWAFSQQSGSVELAPFDRTVCRMRRLEAILKHRLMSDV